MLSASTLSRLANIFLVVGFVSLAMSVSTELSRQLPSEAAESQSLPAQYTSGESPADSATLPESAEFLSLLATPAFAYDQFSPTATRIPIGYLAPSSKTNDLAGAARVPAAPIEVKLAELPAEDGIIFETLGKKICIGGTACEEHCAIETGGCDVKPSFELKLDRPAHIAAIQVYAHDQVGQTRRASLLVKVNGQTVGKTPVYRYGSTLTFKAGRVGQLVTIESMHDTHGFLNGGDEAVIWDVYLFGREPR
jgi:hypothetical protein